TVNGLRILGLGGSMRYNSGEHQYTERQMARRLMRLWPQILRAKGVDVVLTHAPIYGVGDGEDVAHRGFRCFMKLVDTFHPRYFIHGHVHKNYGTDFRRSISLGETEVINAYERYFLEI
ncbi:MAG: metallophosphoesterase, partial [Oscillospiraceae bacterium]|nr:metallophosphoesterase [Oscillospiraceae bacterium]